MVKFVAASPSPSLLLPNATMSRKGGEFDCQTVSPTARVLYAIRLLRQLPALRRSSHVLGTLIQCSMTDPVASVFPARLNRRCMERMESGKKRSRVVGQGLRLSHPGKQMCVQEMHSLCSMLMIPIACRYTEIIPVLYRYSTVGYVLYVCTIRVLIKFAMPVMCSPSRTQRVVGAEKAWEASGPIEKLVPECRTAILHRRRLTVERRTDSGTDRQCAPATPPRRHACSFRFHRPRALAGSSKAGQADSKSKGDLHVVCRVVHRG